MSVRARALSCLSLTALALAVLSPVAHAQNLFVSGDINGSVFEITPAGVETTFAAGLGLPHGLAFDGSGNLYAADAGGSIFEFTPAGVKTTFATGVIGVIGLAFDSSGNLYAANSNFNSNSILEFTPAGVQTTFASGLNGPYGLAFDRSGNLYESDTGSNSILKFTPAGVETVFASGLNVPYGLAFDGGGNLYAADADSVLKFTPAGVRTTFTTGSGGLIGPAGLAFDPNGNLYVSDVVSRGILEFTPAGVQTTFASGIGEPNLIAFAPAALITVPAPTALAGLAPSLPWFLLARFLQGLLLPFIFTVFVAYIADECPGPAALRMTGTYSIGAIIGGFSGRFIAGWTAYFLDWRASFLLLAAITLAAALVLLTTMPAERNFRPVRSWRDTATGFANQLRNPQVLVTCAAGFAVLFSIVATFTFANLLLAAPPYDLGPAELGSIFVTYLLGAVVTPLATRFATRFGRRRTMLAAGLAAGAGILLTLAPSLPIIIAGLSLVALGVLTEQMLSIGYVALAGGRARSTAVGLYVTSYYIGGSLGGIAPASIWSHLGWPGCVLLVLLVQSAAVALTWLAWPREMALR